MDQLTPDELQERLESLGFENLTHSQMVQFSLFLKREAHKKALEKGKHQKKTQSNSRPTSKNNNKINEGKSSKRKSTNHEIKRNKTNNQGTMENNEDQNDSIQTINEEDSNIHRFKREDFSTEEEYWSAQSERLAQKAKALDYGLAKAVQICKKIDRKVPGCLYPFKYSDFKDPYPNNANITYGHGYIYPYHNSHHGSPIYKQDICYPPAHFVQERRRKQKNDQHLYIPGNDNRNDDLRFRIKEKMYYSHPYYKKSK